MAITKMEDIIKKFEEEVEISGFEEGEYITLKLRRISLLDLVAKGTIPNNLMNIASNVFGVNGKSEAKGKGKSDIIPAKAEEKEVSDLKDLDKLLCLICENVILEPPYEELKQYLTDQQKLEIFYYSQGGLRKVQKFREQQSAAISAFNSKNLQQVAERDN